MTDLLMGVRRVGWAVVEAALLLVVLCLLLNIILGNMADSFVSGVAGNATAFLNALPPGILVGLALIAAVYGLMRARLSR